MTYGQLIHDFFADDKVKAALLIITLDFVLGVLAAFKLKTFRLSYVADFGRNDVLFKLLPYFVLYAGALVAGGQDILIEGLDLGVAAGAFYALIIAAWVGSIGSSVLELSGQQVTGWKWPLLASENDAPPKD